jgi:putative intracellular protease/amidase
MTTIVTILTEGFADWETTLLNAVARGYYKAGVHYASPGGKPVTSAGGMQVLPEQKLEDIDLDKLDALIVCGGTIWQSLQAPDLTGLLRDAKAKGKVIGVICDGTVAAARTGILDDVRHTSNGPGYLDGTGYKGKALYQDGPQAVADDKIVTAAATAPVSFMAEVMKQVGLADADLDYYVGMHAAQYAPAQKSA